MTRRNRGHRSVRRQVSRSYARAPEVCPAIRVNAHGPAVPRALPVTHRRARSIGTASYARTPAVRTIERT
jgi:hypothetical protein